MSRPTVTLVTLSFQFIFPFFFFACVSFSFGSKKKSKKKKGKKKHPKTLVAFRPTGVLLVTFPFFEKQNSFFYNVSFFKPFPFLFASFFLKHFFASSLIIVSFFSVALILSLTFWKKRYHFLSLSFFFRFLFFFVSFFSFILSFPFFWSFPFFFVSFSFPIRSSWEVLKFVHGSLVSLSLHIRLDVHDRDPKQTQRPDVITETRVQKQTVVSVDREHRDGCASWVKPVNGGQVWALLTMNGSWQQLQEAKQGRGATQWPDAARNFVNTDWPPHLARTLEPMNARWRELIFVVSRPGCDCTRAIGDRFDTLDCSRCSWPSLDALNCLDKNQLADVLSQFLCWTILPR